MRPFLILGREQIKIIEEEHLYRRYEGDGPHATVRSYWFGATLRRATNRPMRLISFQALDNRKFVDNIAH